jgi:hypothetical protein
LHEYGEYDFAKCRKAKEEFVNMDKNSIENDIDIDFEINTAIN